MAKRTLSNDSSCDAEIKRRPQPGLWRMKLSIQTTYGNVASKHHVKGYVEMEVVEAPPPCTMTYIVVLDKSLSMMTGHRFSNTVQGFRVLNALLGQTMGGAEMIVIPFSNVLDKTYGPYRPPLPPDVVHDICNALRPKGGTDIELALNKAYELAEEIVERNAVTILMLTDGCDTGLQNKMVDYSHSVPLFRTMQAMSSKVFLCLVGICHDADAKLLGALAKMGNGTYTLTADSDIAGLMGSMVALVGERVHEQVALSLSLVHDDGQATLIMSDKAVCLSRAKPTRVPFTAGATTPFALHSSLYMSAMVVTSAVKNMQVVEQEDGLPEPDLECVLMDFERIALDHREAVAALKEDEWRTDITIKAMEEVDELKREYAAVLPLPAVEALDAELLKTKADMELAMHDGDMRRELEHRIHSAASTARNSGMSIGMGSHETPSQSASRSLSMAMTF